jgi:alginate O-acetyltransferase complex protein AlgI
VLFNSYIFIFCFLPAVLFGYLLLKRLSTPLWPITWLVLASFVFYSWWQPEYVLLLLFSVVVNFGFGKLLIDGGLAPSQARAVLTTGIIFNLCLLGYFKYAGFFATNVDYLFGAHWTIPNIILPIGISFITFQKIAFLVDAYRGLVRNFTLTNYMFFVTFFPQLIAGPITHHSEIMPQIGPSQKRRVVSDFAVGISIFTVGLFKKVIVADTLAVYADSGYSMLKAGQPLDNASAWITVLSYSFQLYYDFSGYSDMAVGLARMFGFKLPINFDSPYKSASIIEFWKRWHITLSRFLRDYLYIPLGGNRRGVARRYVNLLVVMLLGGLWHGANWTFVVWGGVHGLMLCVNHGWRVLSNARVQTINGSWSRRIAVAVTFVAVTLAWVPFRAATLSDAVTMLGYLWPSATDPQGLQSWWGLLQSLFRDLQTILKVSQWFTPREMWPVGLAPNYLVTTTWSPSLFLLCVGFATFVLPNTYQIFSRFEPALGLPLDVSKSRGVVALNWWVAIGIATMFVASVLGMSQVSPFLYHQF